ncbi:LCP family protein [Prauserella cavernicola]|uniref:LCP family protein n=1 Tax=Prauserella cavernicola TaxID=2800127 RepID=A0A934V7R8_9PSEU|nr:LCP family protein [Prauserella cavernicola]MBK1788862.1 LCP family protein [Prauserella cavernicola]
MDERDEREGGEPEAKEPADEAVARPVPTPYPRPRPAPAPPRRSRLRAVGRGTVRTVVALLSVVALAATGYAYTTLDDLQDNVQTTDALQQNVDDEDPDTPPPPPQDDGATDILLVGADSRNDMQGNPLPLSMLKELRTEDKAGVNTDTLIVLRIPKNGGKPTGISIPRDTWVDVPQGGKGKINSAYGAAKVAESQRLRAEGMTDHARVERDSDQAGRRALVRTVQDFTQVRIDHYAEINLLGFYLLTESLGGVEVCLNAPTVDKDSGADFAAGPQVVSGGEALSFVRQRKNLPRGDLDRIVRQQVFLSSALNQVLSAGTLTNSERLGQLTETLRRSLVLDPGLNLLGFAEQAKGIANGDMEFVTIPVEQVGARSQDGQSIVTVDLGEVRGFVDDLAKRDQQQPSGGGSAPAAAPMRATAPCVN